MLYKRLQRIFPAIVNRSGQHKLTHKERPRKPTLSNMLGTQRCRKGKYPVNPPYCRMYHQLIQAITTPRGFTHYRKTRFFQKCENEG